VNPPDPASDRAPASRAAWVLLAAAWFAFATALFRWLARTPVPVMREQLKALQFWSLELCLALVVVLVAGVLRRVLRGLTRRDIVRMAVLASAALVLTLAVAPRTNRIYYDEHIYQGIAQNLADLRLAQTCNEGNVEYGRLQCFAGEYNKQPYAYPHLLSAAYRVFGVRESAAFSVNAIVMALSVCAVYLLVVLLVDDRTAAFFAALLLLLTPEQILWSATAAAEPSAALACLVAVACAAAFCRSGDGVALAATGVASAYAAQFRPESLLVLPVVALVLWRRREEFDRLRFWWVALLALALLAVHVGHLYVVRNEAWGTTGERLSLNFLWTNLPVNLRFYLADWRFPAAYTVLAILGAAGGGSGHARLAVSAWFLAFFGVYLLFYAGSYDYGADVRYSLMTYAPLAVLAGLGAARLVGWAQRRFGARFRPQTALAAAIAFTFLWYAPLVRATTQEAWAARADVRFVHSVVPDLRGNAYVLAHNPGVFHLLGVNAGQMSRIVADPGYLDALAVQYSGRVYLHWNFWCNVQDRVQQEFCRKALAVGRFELVREYRERDQRFAVYRLAPATAPR
jgi:hypothetical protein